MPKPESIVTVDLYSEAVQHIRQAVIALTRLPHPPYDLLQDMVKVAQATNTFWEKAREAAKDSKEMIDRSKGEGI